MKKFLFLTTVFIISIMLVGCNSKLIDIEDCEWKLQAVMTSETDDETSVIAVGKKDEVYPNVKIVDVTLVAENGEITLNDVTNNKTYNGAYKVTQKTLKGIDYEIVINGENGYATVAPTKYYTGEEVPTLPISIGGYGLYFEPVK